MPRDESAPDPDPWQSRVDGAELVFRLADPDDDVTGVRLWQDFGVPGDQLDFSAVDGGWELRLGRPSTQRVEYRFEVSTPDGTEETTDPTNSLVVGSAFGDRSWLALPGYAPPAWTEAEPVASTLTDLQVTRTPVGTVDVTVWAPADADASEPLPLLLSHDGPEFATFAGLTHYVGAMVASNELPRMRLALIRPTDRNPWYAANPDYTTALVDHVLPRVRFAVATAAAPVLMGASLGALAALHAEWTRPATFAGLLLQSGSFFQPATDPQESDFAFFDEVTGFVSQVLSADAPPSLPALAMTCGATEENVHNNRVMASHLAGLGLDVELVEAPDVHSFTSWRDMLDPHLTRLLQRLWRPDDAS